MSDLSTIPDAWLMMEDGLIKDFGACAELPPVMLQIPSLEVIDESGRYVLPSFVDSHTHLVFALSRVEEFVMRIKGKSYEELAEAGGGILTSAHRLPELGCGELLENVLVVLNGAVPVSPRTI